VNPAEDLNHDSVAWTWDSYPGDINDLDGEDNDGDGYVDDMLGWDFLANIGDCASGEDCDGQTDNDMIGINDHGTHVAGLMCAAGNNTAGVAGMSWVGSLMALRAGYQARDGQGYIPESGSIPATLYAAAHGAKIINMSYGGPGYSPNAAASIAAAWAQGALVFAASGNDGSTTPQYPANYDSVIAVNATNSSDRLASWSNRGTWTDICAPGASPGIMSTIINSYGIMEGTSMASPNAAGVAALVWSLLPGKTNAELRALLFSTAINITSSNPGTPASHLGHGRIDALSAVMSICPRLQVTSYTMSDSAGGDGDGRLEAGESVRLVLNLTNVAGWAAGEEITVTVTALDSALSVTNGVWQLGNIAEGQSASNAANPAVISAAANLERVFTATIRVTFSSPNGYGHSTDLRLRVGRGRVLLVDDDGVNDFEQYYQAALDSSGLTSDVWSVTTDGALDRSTMDLYPVLLWICGNQNSATLTSDDQTALQGYLSAGGNLILAGQNIDDDLRSQAFYATYLHAQSEQLNGDPNLTGVTGDPISNGMTLQLYGNGGGGNGTLSPSRILPVGGAEPIFTFNRGGTGAIRYAGTYKLVYFSFALEAAAGANETTSITSVIPAVLSWMGTSSAVGDRPATPVVEDSRLDGAYPNPFNPSTTIRFELRDRMPVKLSVYDMTGRFVASLVDAPLAAGSHQVVFDGSSRSSGIYLVRLEAGGHRSSAKIVLVK
jgi:hypothetical protein